MHMLCSYRMNSYEIVLYLRFDFDLKIKEMLYNIMKALMFALI
jgi:hypothetical protein